MPSVLEKIFFCGSIFSPFLTHYLLPPQESLHFIGRKWGIMSWNWNPKLAFENSEKPGGSASEALRQESSENT